MTSHRAPCSWRGSPPPPHTPRHAGGPGLLDTYYSPGHIAERNAYQPRHAHQPRHAGGVR